MPNCFKILMIALFSSLTSCSTQKSKHLETWASSALSPYLIWVHGTQSNPHHYKIFALSNPDIKTIIYNRYDSSLHWKHQIQKLHQVVSSIPKGHKIIIAGHSYGGTLTVAYALTYPEKISEIIVIAAPLQRILRPYWHTPFIKLHPYVPNSPLHQVLYENKQLESLWGYIEALKRPLSIRVHGFFDNNDLRVNPKNINFLKGLSLEISLFKTQNLGHLPHFKKTALLRDLLGFPAL